MRASTSEPPTATSDRTRPDSRHAPPPSRRPPLTQSQRVPSGHDGDEDHQAHRGSGARHAHHHSQSHVAASGHSSGTAPSTSLQQEQLGVEIAPLERALREAAAAESIAAESTIALAKQGEQMKRIDGKLDRIGQQLNTSDKIVSSIASWTGMLTSWITGGGTAAAPPPAAGSSSQASSSSSQVDRPASSSIKGDAGAPGSRIPIRGVKASGPSPAPGMTQTETAQLEHLEASIGRLKVTAVGMGKELETQNRQLERLGDKTRAVNNHMERTNNKVKGLL